MKALSVIDRIVLVLYTVSLGVVSLILLGVAGGWQEPVRFLDRVSLLSAGRLTLLVVGGLLLIANIRLLFVAFAGGWSRKQIVHELPMGRVRVALSAVEGLVARLVRAHAGVKEARAAVRLGRDGVNVYVRATVGPEVEVTALSGDLQQSIRSQVKQVVGIAVEKVGIDVDHIAPRPTRISRVDK